MPQSAQSKRGGAVRRRDEVIPPYGISGGALRAKARGRVPPAAGYAQFYAFTGPFSAMYSNFPSAVFLTRRSQRTLWDGSG